MRLHHLIRSGRLLPASIISLFLASCITPPSQELFSFPDWRPSEISALEKLYYKELENYYEEIPDNSKIKAYSQQLLNELLLPLKVSPQHFRIVLIKTATPIAVTLFNGDIMISTGLLQTLTREDELAALISHELAHHLLHHRTRSLLHWQKQKDWSDEISAKIDTPNGKQIAEQIQEVVQQAKEQKMEVEADLLGAQILHQAQYSPEAMISLLEKIEAIPSCDNNSEYSQFTLLSTHPRSELRFQELKKLISRIKPGPTPYQSNDQQLKSALASMPLPNNTDTEKTCYSE